ncbi:MAG: four helix bundle protein, partial [Candidatus Methylomirabilales bacterium]
LVERMLDLSKSLKDAKGEEKKDLERQIARTDRQVDELVYELYGITGQLRRAAVSVALNVAEGSGRSKKEFAHYLKMARTSVYECIPLLSVAQRQGYFSQGDHEKLYGRCEVVSKMLSRLINSLRASPQSSMNSEP